VADSGGAAAGRRVLAAEWVTESGRLAPTLPRSYPSGKGSGRIGSSGGDGKREKVALEASGGIAGDIVGEKQPTELLTRAKDFAPTRATPAIIGCGHIEQLESSRHCVMQPRFIRRLMGANRPFDLAAHVRQLFHERQG
jgi:hypothetical protein